ncbi:hypothetical protein D8780_15390 [Notoacmeibacter ruber]|uniref:Uncharacterized protein n=2 Tax=Notoacmeibacter ruber TaxID=2670375 RepID=A0A3L7J3C3_9HYPH|nr:hypothetical protein D8780_15390 [Notoacmeibacter ruber]
MSEKKMTAAEPYLAAHANVWRAIDQLAKEAGLTTSGLAVRAGLNATAFNVSKRVAKNGRMRWPSTETVFHILAATNRDAYDFAELVQRQARGDGHGA